MPTATWKPLLAEAVGTFTLIFIGAGSIIANEASRGASPLASALARGPASAGLLNVAVAHGLAISAGVTIYVAASNLVPEFQGKHGWQPPLAFFAGVGVFYVTKLLLDGLA